MPVYVFADESGNFDFAVKQGASRYFILTTVTAPDCTVGHELLALRRRLASLGATMKDAFHGAEDSWPVRAQVLQLLQKHPFRVDATILEKRKALPRIRHSDEYFYQIAWYYHFKHIAPRVVAPTRELVVIGSTIGTKSKKVAFAAAVKSVVTQCSPTTKYEVASLAAVSDPCLQVADYCSWAISRKWESGRDDAYKMIAAKVRTEFDMFRTGATYYY